MDASVFRPCASFVLKSSTSRRTDSGLSWNGFVAGVIWLSGFSLLPVLCLPRACPLAAAARAVLFAFAAQRPDLPAQGLDGLRVGRLPGQAGAQLAAYFHLPLLQRGDLPLRRHVERRQDFIHEHLAVALERHERVDHAPVALCVFG